MTAENEDEGDVLRDPYFELNLTEEEMISLSYLAFQFTPERDVEVGHPPGITVSANRFAHGADVHITLEQARQLRDALTRALHEVGFE